MLRLRWSTQRALLTQSSANCKYPPDWVTQKVYRQMTKADNIQEIYYFQNNNPSLIKWHLIYQEFLLENLRSGGKYSWLKMQGGSKKQQQWFHGSRKYRQGKLMKQIIYTPAENWVKLLFFSEFYVHVEVSAERDHFMHIWASPTQKAPKAHVLLSSTFCQDLEKSNKKNTNKFEHEN